MAKYAVAVMQLLSPHADLEKQDFSLRYKKRDKKVNATLLCRTSM